MLDRSKSALSSFDLGEPRLKVALVWCVLVWERLWRVLWAPATILGGFVAAAWFGLPRALSGEAHTGLLVVVLLVVLGVLWRGAAGFALPRLDEARRRLEIDGDLPHRPLETLRDRPLTNDPDGAALWEAHRRRAAAAIGGLRVTLPRPAVIERDPAALRWLALLILTLAGAGAWGEWDTRLVAALTPRPWSIVATPAPTLDVWLTPPEYTGQAPRFPRYPRVEGDTGPIRVPEGSTLTARVSGGRDAPTLEVGGSVQPFETVEPGTHQIRHVIRSGTVITVSRRGEPLAVWPIEVIPDTPPTIALADMPRSGPNGALRVAVKAEDDYGVASVALRVAPAAPVTEDETVATGPAFETPLTLPADKPRSAEFTTLVDLTAHPWAGLRASLTPTAIDGAGHVGSGSPLVVLLPERAFRHPVARAIIDIRRAIARGIVNDEAAAISLDALSEKPDAFAGDFVVALALRAAADRLILDRGPEAVPAVTALLWDTATRIEDGAMSMAERDLRDVQRRLEEALARDASPDEIRGLMDELNTAMERWLRAAADQARRSPSPDAARQIPPELAERLGLVDDTDLRAMMERMRSLAETGSRDAARAMLSRLRELMESARVAAPAVDQPPDERPLALLRAARDLLNRQQKLLDDTFGVARDGEDTRRTARPGERDLADRQEAIRRDLADLTRRLAELGMEPPRGLARSDRSMRSAAQALRQGRPGTALPRQTQAADELAEALDAMMDAAARAAIGGAPMPGQASGVGRDPFGRRVPGASGPNDGNQEVRLPAESDVRRSREILDELRRRSEERTRPKPERDYIDRLLRAW